MINNIYIKLLKLPHLILKFDEVGLSYKQKLVYTANHGQNIWNKVKKSIKTDEEQKIVIFASGYLLTPFTRVLF